MESDEKTAQALGDAEVDVRIEASVASAVIAHCIRAAPLEGCGLLAAIPGSRVIDRCYPARNEAQSARRYVVDPRDQIRADLAAEKEGRDVVGVFHSHTHTDAYPSPTDIAEAPDPGWHYLIVSLRDEVPALRCYSIADGIVTERPLLEA